jgi:hypothetical protein
MSTTTLLVIGNNDISQACDVISFGSNSDAVNEIRELGNTGNFSNNRMSMWIPSGQNSASFNGFVLFRLDNSSIRNLISLPIAIPPSTYLLGW